jgi:hypothetical protein
LTGDTDHFPAGMRPLAISADNLRRDRREVRVITIGHIRDTKSLATHVTRKNFC